MRDRRRSKEAGTRLPVVLHVIDSLDISGGAERQLVANLTAFDHTAIRHEVAVIRRTGATREEEIGSLAPVNVLFSEGERVSRPRVARRLRRLVRVRQPSLIHASLPDASLAARLVGRLERLPVVESLVNISHEPIRTVDNPSVTTRKLGFHTLVDKLTMRSVTGFHAVSQAVADSWVKVVGLDPGRIRVIPRGVEVGNLVVSDAEIADNRESVRAEFDFPADSPLVISVGRVEPQKGQRYLIEAMSKVVARIPDARLCIVGRAGNASPLVERAISRAGLAHVVKLAGPRRDVARLLSASDVFAFPSLFEGNGGNAMIEAMAAGLAIVTTGAPPMTDLIPDSRYGLLTSRADPASLAEAIISLLADDVLRAELGKRAAERAREFLTPTQIAGAYEAWYKDLLVNRGGADSSP